MARYENSRLRIRQCLSCDKLCRGSEWKKHKATNPGHTNSWRRLFCSSHTKFKHAHSKNRKFISKHSACKKHKSIANASFRKFILDTRTNVGDEHNLSPTKEVEYCESELSDDEEMEEERNINTDGEEEENVDLISESDEDEEETSSSILAIVEEEKKQAETTKVSEGLDKSKNQEEAQTSQSEQPQLSQSEQPKVKKTQTASEQTKKGIKAQNKKWQADEKTNAVSRSSFLEKVYQKYIVLEKTHKDVLKEYAALNSKQVATKAYEEEATMAKASLRLKTVELGQAQAKIVNLEERLKYSSRNVKEVDERNAKLKEEVEQLRKEKEELKNHHLRKEMEQAVHQKQIFELHIPLQGGILADEVLTFDISEADNIACYESPQDGVSCLHLLLERNGRDLRARGVRRIKKRVRTSLLEEPEAQLARFSP